MKSCMYHVPQTVTGALSLLAEAAGQAEEARILAGGTILVPQIKEGLATPTRIVNLKRIPNLKRIRLDDTHVHLGPLVTPTELIRSPIIQEHYPLLVQAAQSMAGVQIRNMATIGGNLCNAAPSADLIPALLVLEAAIQIQGANEMRLVPVDQFFGGPGQTVLQPDELVTEIIIPRPASTASALYFKHALRQAMAIAIVGVGVALQSRNGLCEEVRIALGAVAPRPMRALKAETALRGQPLTDETITTAARLAAEACQPDDDVRSSAWYRRRMVEVLTRRALQQLKAGGGS